MKFPLRAGGCHCDDIKTTATPVLVNFFSLNNKTALKLTVQSMDDLFPAICIAAQLNKRGHSQYMGWLRTSFPHFADQI